MRAFRHLVLGGILCACCAMPALAQITITTNDVASQLVEGNWVTNRYDTHTTQVNIGAAGSSSWDFSALRTDSILTLTSVSVSGSPFAGSFPGATHTLRSALSYAGIAGKAYMYLTLGTNLTNMGIKAEADATTAVNIVDTYTPADVVYGLPSTLGTTWTSTYTESFTLNFFTPGTPTITNHNYSYTVDAYGPMTMPGGGTFDALRIRRVDSTAAGKKAGYMFIAKNGASAQIWLSDVNAPDNGVVGVGAVQWSAPFNTDVASQPGLPKEIGLLQNFPNPFNPSTIITYDAPERSYATIKVFNLLGSEIATLVDGMIDAGRHQVEFHPSGLASGVYLYRLQIGGSLLTRRMIYLK